MILFNTGPGRLVAMPDPALAGQARLVNMTGFPIPRSIITRLMLSSQGNFQALHSLGGQVYVYVFGDRIGQIQVSGMSFLPECGAGNLQHGIDGVIHWYNRNRIAAREDEMEVLIGTTALRGLLTGLSVDTVNVENRVFSFTVGMLLIPET